MIEIIIIMRIAEGLLEGGGDIEIHKGGQESRSRPGLKQAYRGSKIEPLHEMSGPINRVVKCLDCC